MYAAFVSGVICPGEKAAQIMSKLQEIITVIRGLRERISKTRAKGRERKKKELVDEEVEKCLGENSQRASSKAIGYSKFVCISKAAAVNKLLAFLCGVHVRLN